MDVVGIAGLVECNKYDLGQEFVRRNRLLFVSLCMVIYSPSLIDILEVE